MKMHHKWIKEALLRVFVTEQVVPPGPYWCLTASHISAGIKHESKRDFAPWRLLRKQNPWLWKGSDWSLHHTRKPWRGGWILLDFCVDLSWGGGKRGGVAGKGELGKPRSFCHCGWYGAALCFSAFLNLHWVLLLFLKWSAENAGQRAVLQPSMWKNQGMREAKGLQGQVSPGASTL